MKIVNLLPSSEQKLIQQEQLYRSARTFLFASIAVYILLAVALVGWRQYMESTLSNLDFDIAQSQKLVSRKDNGDTIKKVQQYNHASGDYLTLSAANPNWSKVLIGFSKLVPSEVIITAFNANTKTGKIDIAGYGLTRDAVLALRNNISTSSLFQNINLPLENLQKPANVPFTYTFYLADGALK